LAAVTLILFLTFLDNTAVSVTLADVQSSLKAGVTQLQWVVDGYALVFASLLLIGGVLGDILGRKKVMLAGASVFCAGSVVAALAPSSSVLIVGRIVMGFGAAASEPGTLSMIRHLFPERRSRARAIGIWAAVSGLALALGPVIGGALVALAGWRTVFWFNLGFGALSLIAAWILLPENADPSGRHFDLRGAILSVIALVTATFATIQGEADGYSDPLIIALYAVAGVAALAFWLQERANRDPLVRLDLFRHPAFSAANLIAFLAFFAMFSIFFFTALYLQVVARFSAGELALQFLPMTSAMIAAAALTGRWVAASGPRWPMTVGSALAGVGIFLADAALSPSVGYAAIAIPLALVGLGLGMVLVPITSTVLSLTSPERSGMAAAVTNASRQLGSVVGVAVLGAVVNAQLTSSLKSRLNELGIPAQFQSIVLTAITHGGVPDQKAAAGQAPQGTSAIVHKVIDAAYGAFGDGLHIALTLAGSMLCAAALVALFALHSTSKKQLASAAEGSGSDARAQLSGRSR
jgi:EmrB/QacA subfamily drug resistance transporter